MSNLTKHTSPWDRLNDAEKAMHVRLYGRPIRWTKDQALVGTLDETGRRYVSVLAQHNCEAPVAPVAPVAGSEAPKAAPAARLTAAGTVDRRAAGLRVCGNCGGNGHNKRTCKAKRKA